MIVKFTKLFLSLLFLQLLVPARVVLADTGPKPTMDFEFKQELTGEQVTITSGVLYECEQLDCSDASPLMEGGPQRFTCEANSCHALAYGFSPYHRLEIQFSDGQTRQSNIFETAMFNSTYTVTVRPDDLLVEGQLSLERFSRVTIILLTGVCVLAGGGLLIGLIILRRSKRT
ncbi:MAG: hypothetical protein EHM33_16705 [Chloroflexi bacterium]|nr:MAG: hypothetical protein EHM33_16705 [Chloroflexota bacterium]